MPHLPPGELILAPPTSKSLVNLTATEGFASQKMIDGSPRNVVSRENWCQNLHYTGVTPNDDPNRERVYWHRICQELVRKGKIVISGDFVWLV